MPSAAIGLARVPAQELESRVIEKVLIFLKSDAEVFDGLDLARERPEVASRLLTAAKQLAVHLASMGSQKLRELLGSVLWKIILQESRIEIKISSMELRQQLESGGKISSAHVPVKHPTTPSDLISLTVEANRKRCGG
jgi:hypothetical protein